jgi:hypothetical protein
MGFGRVHHSVPPSRASGTGVTSILRAGVGPLVGMRPAGGAEPKVE